MTNVKRCGIINLSQICNTLSEAPICSRGGGTLYKCITCGETGEDPVTVYESDGGSIMKCEHCGSEDLGRPAAVCGLCGKTLFEGEYAYEAGERLFCESCVSEVLI